MKIELAGKAKIEKDYIESEKKIEQIVKEELDRIKKKATQVEAEAKRIGESVENSLNQNERKKLKKKS